MLSCLRSVSDTNTLGELLLKGGTMLRVCNSFVQIMARTAGGSSSGSRDGIRSGGARAFLT